MSASVHGEALGRGQRRWPLGAKLAVGALVLAGVGGGVAWYASSPPPAKPEPVRRGQAPAGSGFGAEFVPAPAARQAPPPPAVREEPEPTPPPPAPEPTPVPPGPPPLRLATMWGTPGLKARVDDARRGGSGGRGIGGVEGQDGDGGAPGYGGEQSEFARRMQTTRYAPVKPAPVRLNPTFTLAADTLIPCVPRSPLSSEMAGPVVCTVQGDVRSMDNNMVLLPDMTRIHGMIERGLGNGDRRLFVVWQYAITPGPDNFMIALDAPSSDPMGQIGLPGDLDRRILERYGPTLALSAIDFVTGAATALLRDTGGNLFNFGSIGGQAGRTLGQMAFERDQNLPVLLSRGPARTLAVYVHKPIDLSRFYALRRVR